MTQSPPSRIRRAAALALLALGACSAGSDLPSDIGDGTPADAWSLEEIVRIGAVDGAPAEMFGRIVDVALGPDGLIYVLDAQASEVRVFDEGGGHLQTLGGPGSGPGELGGPYGIAIDSDWTLWVAEERGRRYSKFTLEGEFIETIPAPFRGGPGRGQLRVTSDKLWDFVFVVLRDPQPDGSTRLEGLGIGAIGISLSNDFAPADTILVGSWTPPGLTVVMGEERGVFVPPFAPFRVSDVGPDGTVWVGTGNMYELQQLRASGDTVQTVVHGGERIPLSEAHRQEVADWLDERVAEGLERDESVLPGGYPFFSRIVVAEDGHVWTFRDAPAGSTRFDVFDPEGRYLGTLPTELKAGIDGVHPYITGSHLLGVADDELGVQSVVLYRITKEGSDDQ